MYVIAVCVSEHVWREESEKDEKFDLFDLQLKYHHRMQ